MWDKLELNWDNGMNLWYLSMSVMKSTNFISVLTILGILPMIVQVQAGRISKSIYMFIFII